MALVADFTSDKYVYGSGPVGRRSWHNNAGVPVYGIECVIEWEDDK